MSTETVTLEIKCPRCASFSWEEIDCLLGSGGIPQNRIKCGRCADVFIVEANIDVYIRSVEGGDNG